MAVLSLCFHTGQVLIVDWLAPGGSGVESTTLHIVTFDWQARFIKLRSPLQILAGYRARVRLGDWSGHGPAYKDGPPYYCNLLGEVTNYLKLRAGGLRK